jgi:hypothetical protein
LEAQKAKRKRKKDTDSEPRAASSSQSSKKKQKKNEDVMPDDEEDVHTFPPVSIAIYITIPKKLSATASKKSRQTSNKPADSDMIKKGPFKISSKDGYGAFMTKLAAALPCRRENIHQQKITWKPLKPANAVPLPLGGEDGYAVLVTSVYSKKDADRMVVLSMPAPAEPMEDDLVRT